MVKNHKKKAVALVLIVMVITSLSLLLMGSIKVLTRTHTTYTTGMSKNGEVNINQSRGKFICYRDKNGNLQQKTIRYRTNGDIENNPTLDQTKNGNCEFTIPQQANSFKITLIGAGGGGSVADAKLNTNITPAENGEDSIAVGKESVTFHELFPNNKYIPSGDIESTLNSFFSNLKLTIQANNNGNKGGSKTVKIFDIVTSYTTLKNKTIEYFKSNNAITDTKIDYNLKIKNVKNNKDYKVKCYGGISQYPYQNFDPDFDNQEKYTIGYNGSVYTGRCNIHDERLGTGSGAYSYSTITSNNANNIFFETTYGETFTVLPEEAFRFRIKHHEANIYESKAGEAGEITYFESRFIAPSGQGKLTITSSNIGKGGKGGTAASPNGKAGGTTSLEVTTNVGKQTIKANGGTGGRTSLSDTLGYYNNIPSQQDLTKEQTYIGENGKSPNIILSSDFGLVDLSAGLSVATTDTAIEKATLPGSSGASGTIIWNKTTSLGTNRIYESDAKPYIAYIRSNETEKALRGTFSFPSNPFARHDNGGEGASGAIIIEW